MKKETVKSNENLSTMGARIRAKRKSMGLSQEQLAERLNVTAALVSNYENDKIDVKLSSIRELASALLTTVGYLVDGEPEMDPEVAEMMKVFAALPDEKMRRIAIEQMRILARV